MNTPVNFELAKLLKEKGYDVECSHYYEYALTSRKDVEQGYTGAFGWKKGECNLQSGHFINDYIGIDLSNISWYLCSAPIIAEVVMWLYEKHGIQLFLDYTYYDGFHYGVKWVKSNGEYGEIWRENDGTDGYDTWNQAYEAAIEYTLNNLIKAIYESKNN